MIFALLLGSPPIDPPIAKSPSEAVATCRADMVENRCAVRFQDVSLQMKNDSSGKILVSSLPSPSVWAFSCQFDRIESIKTCTLSQNGLSIGKMTGSVSTIVVTWGGRKFPGADKVAKIGNHAPMRWDSDRTVAGSDAVRLIEAGKKGGTGLFRWYDWPQQTRHDFEVNFHNFSAVWQIFKEATG